jgi:cytochrome oxidase Cu insertion factor (SCO1/SenC/PrrC family)
LLMLGVFAVPMIAAWVSYFGWHPDKRKNYGELIAVTPLDRTGGTLLSGESFKLEQLQGKWVMTYVGASVCNEVCSRQLYYMRQVRIALGKDQDRVERLWVVTDAGTPEAVLLNSHPGLKVWRAGGAGFAQQFPMERAGATHIFLLDPLGNLMLRFPEQSDPKGMMKDLKLLLKASQIG